MKSHRNRWLMGHGCSARHWMFCTSKASSIEISRFPAKIPADLPRGRCWAIRRYWRHLKKIWLTMNEWTISCSCSQLPSWNTATFCEKNGWYTYNWGHNLLPKWDEPPSNDEFVTWSRVLLGREVVGFWWIFEEFPFCFWEKQTEMTRESLGDTVDSWWFNVIIDVFVVFFFFLNGMIMSSWVISWVSKTNISPQWHLGIPLARIWSWHDDDSPVRQWLMSYL